MSRPRVTLLVSLAALACTSAPQALATPAETLPPGLTVTLQDDHLPVTPEGNIEARLDLVASTGVRVTRVDILWNELTPTEPADASDPDDPAYRWARYDAIVDGLTRRGIAVMFNIHRSPSWANGGRDYQWAPTEDHLAAFMTALARRYDGVTADRAGLVHGPVELFQPWNEPNQSRFFRPQWRPNADGSHTSVAPAIYAGLLARAYAAVKAVQPDAWVIGLTGGPNGSNVPPNGSTGIVTFVRGLVPFHPPADAWSQHLYPAVGPTVSTAMPSFTRLPELIGELDAVRPGLPMLVTEMGWSTTPTSIRARTATEEAQGVYLREAIDTLRAIPRVRLAVWFNMQDNAEWTAGLRRADLSPKPSWDVFVHMPKFFAPPAAAEAPAETLTDPPPAPIASGEIGAAAVAAAVADAAVSSAQPTAVATRPRMTRARCLALKRARKPLPFVCRTKFKVTRPRARFGPVSSG